jgi:hypothetical protein
MKKTPPFVMVTHNVLDAPAWRSASMGARMLYVTLKRRWNQNRKNLVYLSLRVAANELGTDKDQAARWFRELVYYGFIVMERPGCLGVSGKGKAPHYRLTECDTFAPKGSLAPTVQATRDFDRWNEIPFRLAGGFCSRKKTESRPGKPGQYCPGKPGQYSAEVSGKTRTYSKPHCPGKPGHIY